ncbi:beta-amyloid-like protein [Limulus polyphemus]|uniref:Beta-amyloid-like protein n=1 Tax=Limulus polyphemus TaxID=6850 RepID=A0ABM1B5F8_LIMPO|nr:beta-amyloid-like protein [Limulus polyphemus]
MKSYIVFALFLIASLSRDSVGYVEAVAGNIDASLNHFQPMVAILCGHGKIHRKYLSENLRWVTSKGDQKGFCTKDKLEVLEYCRKAYPNRDIRNIVESSQYYKIDSWCKNGQKRCKGPSWVKPYRCLEGPFQSDALLVPEHCLFDHIHNQSICQSFDEWNQTAAQSCESSGMRLQSFAMLLPCGVDIFSGVEFVCCPENENLLSPKKSSKLSNIVEDEASSDEDEEYYDDYEDDDDDFEDEALTTTTTTTTESPVDHYYRNFDTENEHQAFKKAQKDLQESHRNKVTEIMKKWSELEKHYQEMKLKDPRGAEDFKKMMTERFQKTVDALEEEGEGQKRQLNAMHHQRVLTVITLRKKSSMECFIKALDETTPVVRRIEKCLLKLLRALAKDRNHMLHYYHHLLNSNFNQAVVEKEAVLDHLENLNHMANQSILMLERHPSVADKLHKRMMAAWIDLKGVSADAAFSKDTDKTILQQYEAEVKKKQEERKQKQLEEEEKQKVLEEHQREKSHQKNISGKLEKEFISKPREDENLFSETTSSAFVETAKMDKVPIPEEHHNLQEPHVAHAQNQPLHHNEVTFSVRKEGIRDFRWNGSVYITLAFAGIALLTALIVGIVLLRRHAHQSPQGQGFVEVNQAVTPEERHVSNMQINGYENPTYKYFESQN